MSNDKVAIYCRLSTEDMDKMNKGDDSESIQNQKLLLMDYCMKQGFSIHKVYSDDDYSGLDRNRPAFNQMIKDAEAGMFNIILCKTQSRFTRDMELVEKYIHGVFILWDIRFISVIDNVDTSVKGNKKSRQINALINEWYCEDLSENIRAVFRRKMQDGQFLGSFAPYGYMKSPDDRHKLIVDAEAAKVVREIYALYLRGYGCAQISGILTDKGILTPTAYKNEKELNFKNPNSGKYSESFGVWSQNTIKRILRNETYIGRLIQGRERKVSYKSSKVIITPKDEWIIIDNTHESIIDKNSFYTVQGLMDKKRSVHKAVNGLACLESAHALAGKIICLDCGTAFHRSGSSRDGTTHYLRCRLAYKTKNKECTPHYIKLEPVTNIAEKKIKNMIHVYLSNEKNAAAVLVSLNLAFEQNTEEVSKEKEMRMYEAKLQEIIKTIASAYADKVRGVISETDFLSFKQIYEGDLVHLKSRISYLADDIKEAESCWKSLETATELLNKYANFKALTHEIANDFIDNIQIGEKDDNGNQTIIINWLF